MQRGFYREYSELEDRHWWFVARRRILQRLLEDRLPPDRLAANGLPPDRLSADRLSADRLPADRLPADRLPADRLSADRRPADGRLRVLDFGCGTGGWLSTLDRFGSVSAVDADEAAVRFSHSRGREEVQHVPDGERLPFPDAAFDLITALDVLEHLADDVAGVRELHRVAAPGALVLVTVPAFPLLWGDQDEISHHYRRYTRRTLRTALERGGLAVEHLSYFNSVLFPVVAAVRLGRRAVRAPRSDRSDFSTGPGWANALLTRVFAAEAGVVSRRRLPFGVSLVALARPSGSGGAGRVGQR